MKIVMAFPLEPQTIAAPDGLPRAVVSIPLGAKVLYLGVLFPSDVIGIIALVDPPQPPGPGMAPTFKEIQRLEFIVGLIGNVIPDDFLFRAPIKTKLAPEKEGDPPRDGLVLLFEKQAPKLTIVTPGGRG